MPITDEQLRIINTNKNTPLVAAARTNDAECNAHDEDGLRKTCTKMGLNFEMVVYVFERRYLRMNLPHSGLTRAMLFGVFIDALAIGWRGRGFQLAAQTPVARDELLHQQEVVFRDNRIANDLTHDDYDAWTG